MHQGFQSFDKRWLFFCGKDKKALKKENTETSSNKNAATSTTHMKTSQADSSHPNFEEAMDAKLYPTEEQELFALSK